MKVENLNIYKINLHRGKIKATKTKNKKKFCMQKLPIYIFFPLSPIDIVSLLWNCIFGEVPCRCLSGVDYFPSHFRRKMRVVERKNKFTEERRIVSFLRSKICFFWFRTITSSLRLLWGDKGTERRYWEWQSSPPDPEAQRRRCLSDFIIPWL